MGDWISVVGEETKEKAISFQFGKQKTVCFLQTPDSNNRKEVAYLETDTYQMNFIMVCHIFRNLILNCKMFPEADFGSDLNWVAIK